MSRVDFIHESGMYFPWTEALSEIRKSIIPMLAWHVASPRIIVDKRCALCGYVFVAPATPGCGVECIIEFSPAGERLLCMACKPELPWWQGCMSPAAAAEAEMISTEQLRLWEQTNI